MYLDQVEPVVEIAFGSVWTDDPDTFTWVDVSADAHVASLNRGRSSDLDLFSAGTCTVKLTNDDRRYDPDYPDSPYYGQLEPNVPVRVSGRLVAGGAIKPLFYGYADAFRGRPGTHTGTVEVPCTDAFKIFAGIPLRDIYEESVLADEPLLYWPLGSDDDLFVTDLTGNGFWGSWIGDGITRDVQLRALGGGATFPGGASVSPHIQFPRRVVVDRPFSFECWFRADGNGATILSSKGPGVTTSVSFGQTGDGDGCLFIQAGLVYFSEPGVADGDPHHLLVVAPQVGDGEVRAWVDGVEVELSSFTPSPSFDPTADGSRLGASYVAVGTASEVSISDAVLWDDVLSDPGHRAALRFALGTTQWTGDSLGQRIHRVLDMIGWPATLRDIAPVGTIVGFADLAGMTALDYLQLLAQTEQGRLFMSGDGKVTFHPGDRTLIGDSVFTFSDGGDDPGILEGSLLLSRDDSMLFDAAAVQRVGGRTQMAGAARPTRSFELSGLLMTTDREALRVAQRIVWRYGTPHTRVEPWTVQPDEHPASWPSILDLEIGDVVTVQVTPQGVGDPIILEQFIEQITHRITAAGEWSITYKGSPLGPTKFLTIGSDDPAKGVGASMR